MFEKFLNNGLIFFYYFTLVVVITFGLVVLVYLLNPPKPNFNKNYAYECGFTPFFKTVYQPFDIQFYRVGVLFLLFDIEVIILLPWSINFFLISTHGHETVLMFLLVLLFGFIYEFVEGLLNWYPNVTKYVYSNFSTSKQK